MRISDWSSDVCSSDLVPGGLGVFEATLLLAYSGSLPVDRLAGALVLYRGIYYLLPLLVAIAMLAIFELRVGVAAPLTRVAARLSPLLLSAFTLVIGAMLLVSGVTPASHAASDLLALRVPLPLVARSEGGRVGQGCGSTCGSRGAPYH